MCVIMATVDVRPTEEMLRRAWDANPDGAGIAWREENSAGHAEVFWVKGIMEFEEIRDLCNSVPMPYVAHFRVASVGGVTPELTHPFQIGAGAPLKLKGKTRGDLLFHNGHWASWQEAGLKAAFNTGTRIPDGPWSDTRAMAWIVHLFGPSALEFIPNQRGVLFGPSNTKIITGDGWKKINNVWCSNDNFITRVRHYGRICTRPSCMNRCAEGKSICSDCDAKDKAAAAAAKTAMETKPAESGGTPAPQIPLVLENNIIPLNEAERLYKKGVISKTMVKKFRRDHQALAQNIRPAKTRESLLAHTQTVMHTLAGGSTN